MKQKFSFRILALALILVLFAGVAFVGDVAADQNTPQSVGTAFSYQGKLYESATPANGTYDFQFTLFGQQNSGSAIAGPISKNDVEVNDGLFTVSLDFGANSFNGGDRWLEIAVRPGNETGFYTTLVPRQQISPTPYAIYSDTAGKVDWSGIQNVPASLADGDQDTTYTAGNGLNLTDTQFSLASHLNVTGMAAPSDTVQLGDVYKNNQIIAWAKVQANGSLASDGFNFGIQSVTHQGTGDYLIKLDVSVPDGGFIAPVVSPEVDYADLTQPTPALTDIPIAVVDQLGDIHVTSNQFGVYMFDATGEFVDNDFIVIVTGGGVLP